MQGRWTITGGEILDVITQGPELREGEDVPVVPCDDAAIERVAVWLYARSFIPRLDIETATAIWVDASEQNHEHLRGEAEAVLRAAGETP